MIDTVHHIGEVRVSFAADWLRSEVGHPRGITTLPMGTSCGERTAG